MRHNFFILLEKQDNLEITMSHLLYGADVSRNDQRALGNAKRGDLALVWVPETKKLYGVFEIQDRMFYDKGAIGWSGDWPYRVPLKLWDCYLRETSDTQKADLMSFVSKELVTLTDLANLGGYIHSLLYDEGAKLFSFFLANSEMAVPSSVFNQFGASSVSKRAPIDFAQNISSSMAEYVLEVYLLQHQEKLEELVGKGISELYDMLFGYQRRYLDIMTVHKDDNGDPLKTTVIELKVEDLNEQNMDKALDELSFYMFWISDQMRNGKIAGSPDSVFGMLLWPRSSKDSEDWFRIHLDHYAKQYRTQANRVHYVSYDIKNNELFFRPVM